MALSFLEDSSSSFELDPRVAQRRSTAFLPEYSLSLRVKVARKWRIRDSSNSMRLLSSSRRPCTASFRCLAPEVGLNTVMAPTVARRFAQAMRLSQRHLWHLYCSTIAAEWLFRTIPNVLLKGRFLNLWRHTAISTAF